VLDRRIDPEVIVRAAAAAGLKLRSHETFLRYRVLVLENEKMTLALFSLAQQLPRLRQNHRADHEFPARRGR
jgi:hypothetical protein